MLYHFFEWLHNEFAWAGWARLFQYITFRAGLAILISLTISIIFGGRIINFLRKAQVGESVRDLGLAGQKEKEGTPTMGGIIIVLAIIIPSILLNNLMNIYVQLILFATIWLAFIGFMDDYIKVFKKDKSGLPGKFKVLGQIVLGAIIGSVMIFNEGMLIRMDEEDASKQGYKIVEIVEIPIDKANPSRTKEFAFVKAPLTNVPFLKNNELDYSKVLWFLKEKATYYTWLVFIPLIIFIITAVSNGANLTDGLDGLAAGVSAIMGGTLGVLAYVSSNTIIANYLNILYLPNTQELVIFCACFLGGAIGFLWHNAYPARVFMGDTGSLMLGGVIATLAVLIRKELLIPILCGIFLVENLSVMLQVSYFKYTRKKYGTGVRIFKMAPLHHHYQKLGMHEAKIVARFWIVAMLLAVLTIITLKLR